MTKRQMVMGWGKILAGNAPLLSIEITRECPLTCPGCYAYEPNHLGGDLTLREVSDLRGNELVDGVLRLVDRHDPMQISIVGGEPLIRHRELSRILPALSERGIYTLVVTSAVIPIPTEWNEIPKVRIAVSIDGLQPDHDKRRRPATYEKILENIKGRKVDISWVVTGPMMRREGYLDEYLDFWTSRPEIDRVWLNLYTPQRGERSEEILTPEDRRELVRRLPELKRRFQPLLMTEGIAAAFGEPPADPSGCTFAQMSINYSADLERRIEPCFYGGDPDCSQCGCAVTAGLHWVGTKKLFGPLHASHLMEASIAVGSTVRRIKAKSTEGLRWRPLKQRKGGSPPLVQISPRT